MARVIDTNIWPEPQGQAQAQAQTHVDEEALPDSIAAAAGSQAPSAEQVRAITERFGPVDLRRLHRQPPSA